ncbi:polyprenyl synthetase family protein [Streptomyces abikoensis]|uniref:polyprenyl synthetase family protein n=1 Tax=Streptomyces abikoensis TaxID=97398 RepID=UPI00340837A8
MASDLRLEWIREQADAALTRHFTQQLEQTELECADLVRRVLPDIIAGKHMRSSFCYWSYRAAGGTSEQAVWDACAALETGHYVVLVHDDIIDKDDVRRSAPSAHRRFADLHIRSGGRGIPATYGTGTALLLGDLLLPWADTFLAASPVPEPVIHRLLAAHRRMYREGIYGEILELRLQADRDFRLDQCRRVAHYKGGRWCTIAGIFGALLAQAPPEETAVFDRFGELVGEAYQLRDDLIGVFGDPKISGKPAISDLREGKPTSLIALALHHATPAEVHRLRRLYGDPDLNEPQAQEIRSIMRGCGAVTELEKLIARTHDAALDTLRTLPGNTEELRQLAELAIFRQK